MIKKDRKARMRGVHPLLMVLAIWGIGCDRSETPPGFAGVVEYDERVLAFEVGGRVETRFVDRGAQVRQGQELARLDDSLERASQRVAEDEARAAEAQAGLVAAGPKKSELWAVGARVEAARATEARVETRLAREKRLFAQGVTPQAVVDDLERQLEKARAERRSLQADYASLASGAREEEVDSARARAAAATAAASVSQQRVSRYRLESPLSGQVLEVHADTGETVAAGAPVIIVADIGRPIIEVFVPQDELAGIRVGVMAKLRVDAVDKVFRARVEHLASKLEFTPRFIFSEEERPRLVLRVRLRIDDPEHLLHAGVPGFVEFP